MQKPVSAKMFSHEVMKKNFDEMKGFWDQPHFREKFFPILLHKAETELAGPEVLVAINLAIFTYTMRMPKLMAALMSDHVMDLVPMMTDNAEVIKDAAKMWAEVLAEDGQTEKSNESV